MPRFMLLVGLGCWLATLAARGAEWKPGPAPLFTRWGLQVTPENVAGEYPRPQLVRGEWLSLNGLWQFEGAAAEDEVPQGRELAERILVPFPIESALSGIARRAERAWYRRTFEVPSAWRGQRVWLNFGAVDWEARVWINGVEAGSHRGGYDPFAFEITSLLRPEGPQELIVGCYDPTDAGTQPIGKQLNKPDGIWYTPSSGIWQTVWLEPVPAAHVSRLVLSPDVDRSRVTLEVECSPADGGGTIEAVVLDGDRAVARGTGPAGQPLALEIDQPKLWSPESPFLYDLSVAFTSAAGGRDEVRSYFGMRKIELAEIDGAIRTLLNGQPVFQRGPLDQGFWPDGLYTAPSDEALRYDLELTKRLGFNMTRKHVKVEPARWYYWCDKLGLLVWQDMPHNQRSGKTPEIFEHELRQMIRALAHHPSIVMWVVFNEGWGQYDTPRIVAEVKQLDPTRLVSNASGWHDKGVGDVLDLHQYPGPGVPKPDPRRVRVLGEFGGLGLPIAGHLWLNKTWSYQGTANREHLTFAYLELWERVWDLHRREGLDAAVYTQLTDVEGEVNGLATYDREVIKVDASRAAAALAGRFPLRRVLVPTAQEQPIAWRYTLERPPQDWHHESFDDSAWPEGQAGFGTAGTPGSVVRTTWDGAQIWLRRRFSLAAGLPQQPAFLVHHDEDVEIHLNGVLAARAPGHTTRYQLLPLLPEARAVLREGENVLAVYCKQTGGGQYIDVGLVDLE